MKPIKESGIIHFFAILHVAVALLCRSYGITDEIWLTLLSIMMTILLSLYMYANVELIVATVIVINFTGYTLGVYGAELLAYAFGPGPVSHAASTFLTTEIIGWGIFGFLKLLKKGLKLKMLQITPPHTEFSYRHILYLTGSLLIIILFRILLAHLFRSDSPDEWNLLQILDILFENLWLLILMLCIVIVLIRQLRIRGKNLHIGIKTTLIVLAALFMSSATAMIAGTELYHNHINRIGDVFTVRRFFQLFVVSAAIFLIFYSVVYMIDCIIAIHAEIYEEKKKATHAGFRYESLKQQVNPHFLFNSLNILDCLVNEGETERASSFIHKLAGIYRYMLGNSSPTVSLNDEMKFVNLYIDLMKERFTEGFEVISNIPDEAMNLHVIPCSIQMLIENAFKHNKVGKRGKDGKDIRLEIRISASDVCLTVSNNLLPKLSEENSTKVGLDYLNRQYVNLLNKEINISAKNGKFTVILPLIKINNVKNDTKGYECVDC